MGQELRSPVGCYNQRHPHSASASPNNRLIFRLALVAAPDGPTPRVRALTLVGCTPAPQSS